MTMLDNIINPLLALEATPEATRSLLGPEEMGGYAATAVFVIINVLVAYIVIKKLIFKPIIKIIKKREEQIKTQVEEASQSNKEAKEYAEQSKQSIDEARVQASAIIDEAKDNANKQAEVIISNANEEAAEIIARAERDAKGMKKAALDEMKDQISDLAVVISSRILGDVLSADKLKTLANNYTAEVLEEEVNKLG